MLPLVSTQRREQALRYRHTFGQFCCLKSWLMLYDLLDEGTKNLMDEWAYNEHGKPFMEGAPHFSISHCKEGIAVAIDELPIGIDIESIRHADKDLIERTMNEKERLAISELGMWEFTRLWTQKEAIAKAEGTGIVSFEQLQSIIDHRESKIESIEKEKYIVSIAYGKLHCISA